MTILTSIADFFLTQWIWSITFDIYHYPVLLLSMLCILFFFTKERTHKACIISTLSLIFTGMILFVLGTIIADYLCNGHFKCLSALPYLQKKDVFIANCTLATLMSFLQILFFTTLSTLFTFNTSLYIKVACISNGIAALYTYGHIIITMSYLF